MENLRHRAIIFILATVSLAACNSTEQRSEDSLDSTLKDASSVEISVDTSRNSEVMPMGAATNPQAFIVEAASANLKEVEAGKLALQKALHPEVKAFANRMINDHGKALDELKSLAGKRQFSIPSNLSSASQGRLNDLNKFTGEDFDKQFMNEMIADHKRSAELLNTSAFQSEIELDNFIKKSHSMVEMHYKEALEIAKRVSSSRN